MNVQKTGVVDMRTATTPKVHLDARARNVTEETDFNVSVSSNKSISMKGVLSSVPTHGFSSNFAY